MHFGPMRINADLDGFHTEISDSLRLFFANQNGIRFQFDTETANASVLQNLEEIPAHQDLTAAQCEKKNARFRKLIQKILDFGGGHLAVIFMIEITMDAPLVATIGQVQLDSERNSQLERFGAHFFH